MPSFNQADTLKKELELQLEKFIKEIPGVSEIESGLLELLPKIIDNLSLNPDAMLVLLAALKNQRVYIELEGLQSDSVVNDIIAKVGNVNYLIRTIGYNKNELEKIEQREVELKEILGRILYAIVSGLDITISDKTRQELLDDTKIEIFRKMIQKDSKEDIFPDYFRFFALYGDQITNKKNAFLQLTSKAKAMRKNTNLLSDKEFKELKLFFREVKNKDEINLTNLKGKTLEIARKWALQKGKKVINKPIIYIVCSSNICRSRIFMAALNAKYGDKYEFRSAGVYVDSAKDDEKFVLDSKPLPQALRACKKMGWKIDSDQFSKQITKKLVDEADLVICMSEKMAGQIKRLSGKNNAHKIRTLDQTIPDPFDGESFTLGQIEQMVQIDPSLPKTREGIAETDAAYQFLVGLVERDFVPYIADKLEKGDFLQPASSLNNQEDHDFVRRVNEAIDKFDLDFFMSVDSKDQGKMNVIIAARFKKDFKEHLKKYTAESRNNPHVQRIVSDEDGAIEYAVEARSDKPLLMLFGIMKIKEYSKSRENLDLSSEGISYCNQLPNELVENLMISHESDSHRWPSFWKCSNWVEEMIDELLFSVPLLMDSDSDLQEYQDLTQRVIGCQSSLSKLNKSNPDAINSIKKMQEKYFQSNKYFLTTDEENQLKKLINDAKRESGWDNDIRSVSWRVLNFFYYNDGLCKRLSLNDFSKLERSINFGTMLGETRQRWYFLNDDPKLLVQDEYAASLLLFAIQRHHKSFGQERNIWSEKIRKLTNFLLNDFDLDAHVPQFKNANDQKEIGDHLAKFLMNNSLDRWQVIRIIRSGLVNVNYQALGSGSNLLKMAVMEGDLEMVEVIVRAGVNIDMMDVDGFTALHEAILRDDLDMARLLIRNKANANLGNDSRHNLLLAAMNRGNIEMVRLLIKEGKADVNFFEYPISPLSMAIEAVSPANIGGRITPLAGAIGRNGNYNIDLNEIILILMKYGADPYIKFDGKDSFDCLRDPKKSEELKLKYEEFLKNNEFVAIRVGNFLLSLKLKGVEIHFHDERLRGIFKNFSKESNLEYADAIEFLNGFAQTKNKLTAVNTDIENLQQVLIAVTEESLQDNPFESHLLVRSKQSSKTFVEKLKEVASDEVKKNLEALSQNELDQLESLALRIFQKQDLGDLSLISKRVLESLLQSSEYFMEIKLDTLGAIQLKYGDGEIINMLVEAVVVNNETTNDFDLNKLIMDRIISLGRNDLLIKFIENYSYNTDQDLFFIEGLKKAVELKNEEAIRILSNAVMAHNEINRLLTRFAADNQEKSKQILAHNRDQIEEFSECNVASENTNFGIFLQYALLNLEKSPTTEREVICIKVADIFSNQCLQGEISSSSFKPVPQNPSLTALNSPIANPPKSFANIAADQEEGAPSSEYPSFFTAKSVFENQQTIVQLVYVVCALIRYFSEGKYFSDLQPLESNPWLDLVEKIKSEFPEQVPVSGDKFSALNNFVIEAVADHLEKDYQLPKFDRKEIIKKMNDGLSMRIYEERAKNSEQMRLRQKKYPKTNPSYHTAKEVQNYNKQRKGR